MNDVWTVMGRCNGEDLPAALRAIDSECAYFKVEIVDKRITPRAGGSVALVEIMVQTEDEAECLCAAMSEGPLWGERAVITTKRD
jgi:hypothetical protein